MPTTRPLAFALIVALAAGSAAPDSLAAKKPAAKKKAPAVAMACADFHAEANKPWLAHTLT